MFVFAFAAPALLVVAFGYALGYAVAEGVAASADVSEPAGWTTGLLMLVVVVRIGLKLWRRRGGHQK